MKLHVYKMTCLTNLHVGSGDVNYSVIDLEVERDSVLGEPAIFSSGIKGALRDFIEEKCGENSAKVKQIFGGSGREERGQYRFLQANLLARPVRVQESACAYALATTPDLIQNFQDLMKEFGCTDFEGKILKVENTPVTGRTVGYVEGLSAEKQECDILKKLFGSNWALLSVEQMKNISLPVLAHNVLENGTSKNLWYEEIVPHKSIFYLAILTPEKENLLDQYITGEIVQFGASASTGYGLVKLEKVVSPQ